MVTKPGIDHFDEVLSHAIKLQIAGQFDDAMALFQRLNLPKYVQLAESNKILEKLLEAYFGNGSDEGDLLQFMLDYNDRIISAIDRKESDPFNHLMFAIRLSSNRMRFDHNTTHDFIESAFDMVPEYDTRLLGHLLSWLNYVYALASLREVNFIACMLDTFTHKERVVLNDYQVQMLKSASVALIKKARFAQSNAMASVCCDETGMLRQLLRTLQNFILCECKKYPEVVQSCTTSKNVLYSDLFDVCYASIMSGAEYEIAHQIVLHLNNLTRKYFIQALRIAHTPQQGGYDKKVIYPGGSYVFTMTIVQSGRTHVMPVPVKYAEMSLLSFKECQIIGNSGTVVANDHYIAETCTFEGVDRDAALVGGWGVINPTQANVLMRSKDIAIVRYPVPMPVQTVELRDTDIIINDSFRIVTSSVGAFAHWLLDGLSRILVATHNLPDDARIIFFSPPTQYALDTLEMVGIARERVQIIKVERQPVTIKGGVIPIPNWSGQVALGGDAYGLNPQGIKLLREAIMAKIGNRPPKRDRVYVPRPSRTASNVDLVEALLDKYLIRRIDFSKMSAWEQIQVFYDADVLICPQGAGLANLLYMRPGTTVISFCSAPVPMYNKVAEMIGVRFVTILPPSDHDLLKEDFHLLAHYVV